MSRITSFRLWRTRLKCHKPFVIATGVSDTCQGLVIELQSEDGGRGLGEAVPLPYLTGETLEGAAAALREILLPALIGLPVGANLEAHRRMAALTCAHHSARAGVDMALHDLCARQWGVPLVTALGGRADSTVTTNYSIGITTPEEAAREARSLVEQGYQTIKLKVGQGVDADVARVKAVRTALGPDLGLRIDANEGWSRVQAAQALTRMEPFRVELVEQPVARTDFAGLAWLRRRCSIPIAADESLRTPVDALSLAEMQAVDIFNLKLMKCAGLLPARDIIAVARAAGISMMVGGMVGESVLSVTAAASLAAAFRFEYADLDADLLLADRVQSEGGLTLEGDQRVFDARPGLGVDTLDLRVLTEL